MSRRALRRPGPDSPCPCGTGLPYGRCCGPCHTAKAPAATAEALMRSRYSAFATGDEAYLLRTWSPATRPRSVDLDPRTRWTGLEILATEAGSAFHTSGTVSFRARYEDPDGPAALSEHSRFARHEGAWVYVDGDVRGGA